MGRSGYTDDCDDPLDMGRWRAQVASAIRGKRGQAFLRDLLEALDNMPDKRLIAEDIVDENGCMCTLGVIGAKRGFDLDSLDPYEHEDLARKFNIAAQLVQEIEFENDEAVWRGREDPEQRWKRMRDWVASHIRSESGKDGER